MLLSCSLSMKQPQEHSEIDEILHAELGDDASAQDVASGQRVMSQLTAQMAAARALEATSVRHDPRTVKRASVTRWRMGWHGVVVAVCTLVVVAGGLLLSLRHQGVGVRRGLASQVALYSTRIGQRATLTLVDGSRVTLAPQTTLRVQSGFGTSSRIVSLSGEAYFDVAHRSGAPFVVRTGAVDTRVVGTAFSVRRYPEDPRTRIAVTTGKVEVSTPAPHHIPIVLTAGVIGMADDSSAELVSTGDATPYTAWLNGRLVFHKTPAIDVLTSMTRWYGYRFQFADSSVAHEVITVGLSTESASAAFATLKQILDVDLTFNGNVVTLSARRASVRAGLSKLRNSQGVLTPSTTGVGR